MFHPRTHRPNTQRPSLAPNRRRPGGPRTWDGGFTVMQKNGRGLFVPPGGTISIDEDVPGAVLVSGTFEYRFGPTFAKLDLFSQDAPVTLPQVSGGVFELFEVSDWIPVPMTTSPLTWAADTFAGPVSFTLRADFFESDIAGIFIRNFGTAVITINIIDKALPAEFRNPTFDFRLA